MAEWSKYTDRDAASRRLAASIAARLREAVAARGQASLVVSGGSSPRLLFEYLSRESLPWPAVTVIPSDERWVPTGDSQSNERLIRETLLTGEAAAARLVGLYREVVRPSEALDEVAAALEAVKRPLDVVLLGMGSDGHTASLFPDAGNIEACLASQSPCVALDVGPPARLSLTLAYLTRARSLDLLVFGEEKRRVLATAKQPGAVAELP